MREYIECKCDDNEHTIGIEEHYFEGDDNWQRENELIVSTMMSYNIGFFGRIKVALGYIFGKHCKFGHFNCTIIDENGVLKLKELCDRVLNRKEILE